MPEKKARIPIPDDVAAQVIFDSDRICCVCHIGGKQVQIHHINDDPSDNQMSNLSVLCLECHSQTQISGGFTRRLNSRIVTLYRDHWVNLVEMRRSATKLHNELERTSSQTVLTPASNDGPSSHTPQDSNPRPVEARQSDYGLTYVHLGIKISLIDVLCTRAIRMKTRSSMYDDEFNIVHAGEQAKFVSVATRVLNDAQVSIDLTCSYPIGNHLLDSRDRQFDAIADLSDIPGNPECNANLQPGFESDMTWIYRVPEPARIVAFEFEDLTDWSRDSRLRPVRIPLAVPEPS